MANILILGAGGREHAIAHAVAASPRAGRLFVAPGNAGTAAVARNLSIDPNQFEQVAAAVAEHQIGLVVVGPEEPLVRGIADYFAARPDLAHVRLIGPSQAGARLEGSKAFSKAFMERHHIPTARARTFTLETLADGVDFLQTLQPPFVLKADGLAAGKGVIIVEDRQQAARHLKEMLEGQFGQASRTVLIEEYLNGIELSVFALTDGQHYVLLPSAKDYKRIGEGDTGPNTGGMGAVSPVPFADDDFMRRVEEQVVRPTIQGLQQEGIPYIGFIFFGLMNVGGIPYVIEYNVRMGDPETEVVFPRLQTDVVELFMAAAEKRLDSVKLQIREEFCTTVMMVSGGYPGSYAKGFRIEGLENVSDALCFHAGTTHSEQGEVLSNGGRVLAFSAFGLTLAAALEKSYQAAAAVHFQDCYYRKDIGADLARFSE